MWILLSLLLVPATSLPSPGLSDPQLSAWYLANEYYPPGAQRPRGHYGPHDGNAEDTGRRFVDTDRDRPEPDPDESATSYPTPGYTDAYYSGRDWENEYDEYDDGTGAEYDDDYAGNAEVYNTKRLPEESHRLHEEQPHRAHDEERPRIGSMGMNGPFPWMPTDTYLRRTKRYTGQDLSNQISSWNEMEPEENSKDNNLITASKTNKLKFESVTDSEGAEPEQIAMPHRKKRGFYSDSLHRHTERKNAWKNQLGVFGFFGKKEDLTKLRRTKRGVRSREMDAPSYRDAMGNYESNSYRNAEEDDRDGEAQKSSQDGEYDALHPFPIPPPGTEKQVWRFDNEYDPFSMDKEYDNEEDSNDENLDDYPIEPSGTVSDSELNQHPIEQESSEMRNRAFGILEGQSDMSSEMQTSPVDEDNASPGFIQDYESYPRDDASSMEEATGFSDEQMGRASMSRPTPRMHGGMHRRFRRDSKTSRGYASSSEEMGVGNVLSAFVDPISVPSWFISDNVRGKRSVRTVPFHRHRDQRISYPVGQVGIFGVERRREDLSTVRRA